MLKQSPLIDELCIHDLKPTTGLGLELNHIDTKCKVSAFTGKDNLQLALQHSNVVAVVAAAPGAESLPYDKMWEPNSLVVKEVMGEVARICPKVLFQVVVEIFVFTRVGGWLFRGWWQLGRTQLTAWYRWRARF